LCTTAQSYQSQQPANPAEPKKGRPSSQVHITTYRTMNARPIYFENQTVHYIIGYDTDEERSAILRVLKEHDREKHEYRGPLTNYQDVPFQPFKKRSYKGHAHPMKKNVIVIRNCSEAAATFYYIREALAEHCLEIYYFNNKLSKRCGPWGNYIML